MYPVDLHMHTVASTHAYSNLHDYIAQAKLKGIKLFAITDHGPDMADAPHYWHFVNMRIWPRLVDGIGILRGIEANIKNTDGQIDCTPGADRQILPTLASSFCRARTAKFTVFDRSHPARNIRNERRSPKKLKRINEKRLTA